MGNNPSSEEEIPPTVEDDVEDEVTSAAAAANAANTANVAASLIQRKWKKQQTEFRWPKNLYVELMDMYDMVSLGSILDQLFKAFHEMDQRDIGLASSPESLSKLTVARLQSIVESKKELLAKSTKLRESPDEILAGLQRISATSSSRKLSIIGIDAEKLKDENDMFYFLIKDDKLKRMTLVLQPDHPEYDESWTTKLGHNMNKATLKRALQGKNSGERISSVGVHQGFYNYLFTKKGKGEDLISRYNKLIAQVSSIFRAHPKHRLYITGFGVGGAIAHMLAFFLSFEDSTDIPKPISIINYASPRVGDGNYWKACQLLEYAAKLRTCRVVMAAGDSLPSYPSGQGYTHAGYQASLGEATKVTYPPNGNDGLPHFGFFTGQAEKTARKSPKDYLTAMKASEEVLKSMDLNSLYGGIGVKSMLAAEPSTASLATASTSEDTALLE